MFARCGSLGLRAKSVGERLSVCGQKDIAASVGTCPQFHRHRCDYHLSLGRRCIDWAGVDMKAWTAPNDQPA